MAAPRSIAPAEAPPLPELDSPTGERPAPSKTPLIRSKLDVPHIPLNVLSRPRLIGRLEGDGRVALVTAPAGYGKSTVLAQWAKSSRRPVAWVALDADDSDPVRFWAHVIGALRQAIPDAPAFHTSTLPLSTRRELVATIVNQLCALETGVVIVLDDYHDVRAREVDDSLERLINGLPTGSAVVISTRRDPDLALARWRAAEQLIEIRQRDLTFTESEVAAWLQSRSIEATQDTVRVLLAESEGWPAAFTLAFGSTGLGADIGNGFAHRHIAEYIQEEVVRNHDDDSALLAVAAFCPEICAALVEHTLEIPDGQEALVRLERSDVLFERLDASGEWFRLHRLVADHVLLGHESDAEIRQWMVRAARWYTAAGHTRTALDILLRAGQHAEACEMINRSWLQHLRHGELATLRNDLARIAPEIAASNAPFLVTRAWLYAHEGRSNDALRDLARAEAVTWSGPLPDECPSVEAASAIINALFAVEGLPSLPASAGKVDAMVDVRSMWRPLADLAIGYASFMTGDLAQAQEAFARTLASSDVLLRIIAIGWSTVADVIEGRVESASARFDDELAMWSEDPVLRSVPAICVAKAAIAVACGRPIEAAAELERCTSVIGSSDPTDRLEVLVWRARAEASIGRTMRARQCIESANRILTRLGGSAWHSGRLREIEAQLVLTQERNGRDPGLTHREERILQLLSATHLSQREIGRELGVSFNTVKSHVKAIYVKLGATSREEASQIARNRGLI